MRASSMFNTVEQHSRQQESSLRAAEAALSKATEQELRLQHDIVVKLRKIALLQLDGPVSPRGDVLQQLELRKTDLEQLKSRLSETEANIATAIQERNTLQKDMATTAANVQMALANNPSYGHLIEAMSVAMKARAAAEDHYLEISEECSSKLVAFEKNPLYRYLRSANFGAASYNRRGVPRAMDRWVATLCSFSTNQANEAMLRAMQAENQGGFDLLETRCKQIQEQLDLIKRDVSSTLQVDVLAKALQAAEEAISRGKDKANAIQGQLQEYVEKTDSRYMKARDMLADVLNGQPAEVLIDKVRQTPGLDDDALAEDVISLQGQLHTIQAQFSRLHTDRERANRDYQKSKGLERQLRDSKYSNDRYEYPSSFRIDDLLVGYMAGRLSDGDVLRDVSSHRREIPPVPTYTPASTSSSSSSFDFSTTSSAGGGAFSTTDSF